MLCISRASEYESYRINWESGIAHAASGSHAAAFGACVRAYARVMHGEMRDDACRNSESRIINAGGGVDFDETCTQNE